MNINKLKDIIKILEESSIDSLTYKDETIELSLNKSNPNASANIVYQSPVQDVPVQTSQSTPEENFDYIKAPLVGVFYTKPAPDKEAFVKAGSQINEGDVICIIESMKVMNEIKAAKSGIIKEILVEDGAAVSFDQPLFVLQ